MKVIKVVASVLVCGIALGSAPARAASECGANVLGTGTGNLPVPGVGLVAGANGAPDNQPGQSCTFTAGSAVHVANTQRFRIFLDPNSNQRKDSGEQVLAETGAPPAGALTIPAGASVTVQILGACSDAGVRLRRFRRGGLTQLRAASGIAMRAIQAVADLQALGIRRRA